MTTSLPNIDEDFNAWYHAIVLEANLIDHYDISGCYIFRPSAFAIWENIQNILDHKLKQRKVKNTYFPLFVSRSNLEREAVHISDFSPEVAWVTHAGSHCLEQPIAIRPTSETIMYPHFSKWLKKDGYHALPYKFNQWCNVVRSMPLT